MTCPKCNGTGEHEPEDLFDLCHEYPAGMPKLLERVYKIRTKRTPNEALNQKCQRCNGTGIDPWADLAAKQIDSEENRY